MKILVLTREYPPYAQGGMGRVVQYMAKFSSQYGLELTIIANNPFLKISRKTEDGIVIYRVPALGSTFLTKLPTFSFFASQLVSKLQDDFDMVYSNSSPIFCKLKPPLVVHFQGSRYGEYIGCKLAGQSLYSFLNRAYVPFERGLISKAGGIIALSENMVSELNKIEKIRKEIEIIPNGVDVQLFKPLSMRLFNSPVKNILYVGRLDLRKGIDILLRAFKQASEKVKARLIIAGSGREEPKLKRLAQSLTIPVDFLGRVPYENLPHLYNKADLCVLPSLYEGFPLVVLEAMACATPTIISSACPDLGIPRFEKNNAENLKEVLCEYLGSDEKLKLLSEKCLQVSQEYSWTKIIPRIVNFINKFPDGCKRSL